MVGSNSTTVDIMILDGGKKVSNWFVTPTFPSGLSIDTAGVISGFPDFPVAKTEYTIIAVNTGGSSSLSLNLTVIDVIPDNLVYSHNPVVYEINSAIATNWPSTTGGPVVSYYHNAGDSLPIGLVIDSESGNITGTPTVLFAQTYITMYAENSGTHLTSLHKYTRP